MQGVWLICLKVQHAQLWLAREHSLHYFPLRRRFRLHSRSCEACREVPDPKQSPCICWTTCPCFRCANGLKKKLDPFVLPLCMIGNHRVAFRSNRGAFGLTIILLPSSGVTSREIKNFTFVCPSRVKIGQCDAGMNIGLYNIDMSNWPQC